MPYIISKTILQKKKAYSKVIIDVLIVVFAIPVAIIAMISLAVYYLFVKLSSWFIKEKAGPHNEEVYHYETVLLENDFVKIVLEEDETDTELTMLNQLWSEQVYNKETCLYRAKTSPVLQELNGRICCFYLKEHAEGAILQVLAPDAKQAGDPLNTRLLFLRYKDQQTFIVDEVGAYFLYNDEKDSRLIKGFNEKEMILIEVDWPVSFM